MRSSLFFLFVFPRTQSLGHRPYDLVDFIPALPGFACFLHQCWARVNCQWWYVHWKYAIVVYWRVTNCHGRELQSSSGPGNGSSWRWYCLQWDRRIGTENMGVSKFLHLNHLISLHELKFSWNGLQLHRRQLRKLQALGFRLPHPLLFSFVHVV